MRAIVCDELGPAPPLRLAELPDPEPGPGEVRLRVRAAGVNFADLLLLQGRYQEKAEPPFTPGLEVAGEVEAVGPGVVGLAPGTRALALLDRGGFAERAVARAADVVPLPADVDDATAAGFAIAYGTAELGLGDRAGLRPGELLLVHGAAGGVGLAAVECGRAMGARVVATARGEDKLALARERGAALALDSDRPDLLERLREAAGGGGGRDGAGGFAVVFDPVGGALFDLSLRTVAWEGRILLVGFASGDVPRIPADRLLVKNASALGFYWGSYRRRDPARLRPSFERLFAWVRLGRIRPHVSHALPLERAADALDLLRGRRSTGKVVLLA